MALVSLVGVPETIAAALPHDGLPVSFFRKIRRGSRGQPDSLVALGNRGVAWTVAPAQRIVLQDIVGVQIDIVREKRLLGVSAIRHEGPRERQPAVAIVAHAEMHFEAVLGEEVVAFQDPRVLSRVGAAE